MRFDELRDKLCANLTWQERCLVILEYHEAQEKAHAIPVDKRKKGWTLKDTASDIGISYTSVYWKLKLGAEIRKGNEKIISAKSENQAIFILEREGVNTKVEVHTARTLVTGTLLTTTDYHGTEICIIKLSMPIKTSHMDIDLLAVPRNRCRIFKDN